MNKYSKIEQNVKSTYFVLRRCVSPSVSVYGNKPSLDNINTWSSPGFVSVWKYQWDEDFHCGEGTAWRVWVWVISICCCSSSRSPWWSASVWLPPPAGPSGRMGCGTFRMTTTTTSRGSGGTTTLSTVRRSSVLSIQQIPAVEMWQRVDNKPSADHLNASLD